MVAVACLISGRGLASEPAAEAWVTKRAAEWPQIVLTNETSFRGHTALHGASAFLLRLPKGEIVGATALHLLGENGGVSPILPPSRLDNVLEAWSLFPRTRPEVSVAVKGLGPMAVGRDSDWLILRVDRTKLPDNVAPLRPRERPVAVGERVFLIGVSYAEPNVAQKVYSGTVTRRDGDRFRFDITPSVDITGFSGAPIVDRNGLLVGVTSVWFEPKAEGGRHTESGGEDVATLLGLLK
jgi:hypothetical protein